MAGHICPECGTGSRPGAGPGCACASRAAYGAPGAPGHVTDPERAAEQQRIADEHHAGRSAEMAAAEDFDPLRIRPYVTLGGDTVTAAPTTPPPGAPHVYGPEGDAATTMPLFLDPADPPPTDAALLLNGPDPVTPRRRRPFAAVIAGAAVVTVVGTAAFVGGLFNGDGNGEADLDQALPSTVASLPDESEPSPSTTPSASASPSRSASPSATASASASRSASPPASTSASPSASASRSATASTSPSATAESSDPAEGLAPPQATPDETGTLRRGDHGPEVAELQRRLKDPRVGTFFGPIDSDYTDRVEQAVHVFQSWWNVTGDPDGAYGPNTRRRLEEATPEHDWH
ncbi:peptidoglycan-binding protein [Streptomyces sp. NBC_00727]|uniref:peptidoglycan-binding domain-containing protein n=1 Tax=Streptomyces sp. NBC_00727 TaxID=2903675 RepID=UPI0038690F6F